MSSLFDVDEPLPHDAQRAAMGRPDRPTIHLTTALQVRTYLDALNDNGLDYKVAGIDSCGVPFLAYLEGPYAETSGVLTGNPWDGEVSYPNGTRCDDCSAARPSVLPALFYPVTILTRTMAGT